MSGETEAIPGPKIVASWVYGAINPVIDLLGIEVSFLQRGNVTFRFVSGELEFIKPLRAHLSPPSRRVLDDMLRSNADVAEELRRHDAAVSPLAEAAASAFVALGNSREFSELVASRVGQFRERGRANPGGAYSADKIPLLVAERVINQMGDLADYYSDSEFWRENRSDFLTWFRGPEFDLLSRRRTDLQGLDQELVPKLEAKSLLLRAPLDLPAAPLPPPMG